MYKVNRLCGSYLNSFSIFYSAVERRNREATREGEKDRKLEKQLSPCAYSLSFFLFARCKEIGTRMCGEYVQFI